MLKKKQKKLLIKSAFQEAVSGNERLLVTFINLILEQKKLKTRTTNDILMLLKQGKITVREAKDLMSLFKDKTEIEEVPKIIKQLERMTKK